MKKPNLKKYSFISLILVLFFIPMIVKSNTSYKGTTTTTVNLRAGAGTGYNIVTKINNNTQVNVINNTKIAGSGCSDGWYYVTLVNSNTPGYVCSTYLIVEVGIAQDKYLRPWLTPGTSIRGGALFVGEDYISKGQFTSYLKKFQVNPNSSYPVHNHQYMTNIRAPRGEAVISYNAYNSSGMLSLPLRFSIPVYLNMPDVTNLQGESRNNPGQETTTPDFEAYLNQQGFPESYKRYLRWLHDRYPNWIFEAMHTNLDWNDSVSRQRSVGAIDSTQTYLCDNTLNGNGTCKQTESGWYTPTLNAAAYFLDPRNFLEERYILMFELLSFSEHFNETHVQYVLNGTFMAGISALDNNRTYASLFMEAGRNANVNPVYIASLSRQEVGVGGSATTSGSIFTYEGITYQGLYNFYNIGASSSASNPALRGLVWASGGSLIPIVSGTPITPETGVAADLSNLGYKIDGAYITGFQISTTPGSTAITVGTFKGQLTTHNITVLDQYGNIAADSTPMATGFKIKIAREGAAEMEQTVIIYGDTRGTGSINSADLLAIRQEILNPGTLTGVYSMAAQLSRSGSINSADLLLLRQHLLEQRAISQ